MPNVHKVVAVSQEVVAAELGVSTQAIANWYARGLQGLPAYIEVEGLPGSKSRRVWRKQQLAVWRNWHARHLALTGKHIGGRSG
jgi:hypothetical protein